MNIGQAAERSGLPAKTIRYYEEIGLVAPARADNGYRDYSDADVHTLRFVQRARAMGFSVEECRALLALYTNRQRSSADVKALAREKLGEIDRRLAQMMELRATLEVLVDACHGDRRPDCPILDGLAGPEARADGAIPGKPSRD